ncbi:hypothetical protein AruPA_06435 [Acidiphilium sp. PA]|nr:hypothetical protein [Acidiphilium sp. PA]MCW8306667.1 hypothetical protein [Acidiphilium sp. PA]
MDFGPVPGGGVHVGAHIGFGFIEWAGEFGQPRTTLVDDVAPVFARARECGRFYRCSEGRTRVGEKDD